MARIELEIDDTKGEIVGEAPESLKAILARIENTAHGAGFGKGAAKAAEEAKAQIAAAVAAEKAKLEAMAPLEREKYQREADENKTLKQQMLEANREFDRQFKAREEAHATQLLERADALKKRNARIQELTAAQLRGEALRHGAREETLDVLQTYLQSSIGYDDDMNPFVRDVEGNARTVQGKPMSVSTFVKEFLDSQPVFKRAAHGTGGGARGGASFQGHSGANVSAEAARSRVEAGDRSSTAINDLFEATRQRKSV